MSRTFRSVIPPKGYTDIRAYYKGTSLVFTMPTKSVDTFINGPIRVLDGDKPLEDGVAFFTKVLDEIEEGLCRHSKKVGPAGWMFGDQDKLLKDAFPELGADRVKTLWIAGISYLLKKGTIKDDNDNGWLITTAK